MKFIMLVSKLKEISPSVSCWNENNIKNDVRLCKLQKGALDSQPQVIKFSSCLPMVGGSLRVLRLLPLLKLVAMILLKYCWTWRATQINQSINQSSIAFVYTLHLYMCNSHSSLSNGLYQVLLKGELSLIRFRETAGSDPETEKLRPISMSLGFLWCSNKRHLGWRKMLHNIWK